MKLYNAARESYVILGKIVSKQIESVIEYEPKNKNN